MAKTFDTWNVDISLCRLVLCWLACLSDSKPIPLDNLPDEHEMLQTTQDTIGEDSILFSVILLRAG
jgi:hypothetical protein